MRVCGGIKVKENPEKKMYVFVFVVGAFALEFLIFSCWNYPSMSMTVLGIYLKKNMVFKLYTTMAHKYKYKYLTVHVKPCPLM